MENDKKEQEKKRSEIAEKIIFCILIGFILLLLVLAGFILAGCVPKNSTFLTVSVNLTECKTEYLCIAVSFYIVFLAVILLAAIICFTVFSIKLNRHILRSNKLASLKENYDKSFRCICPCCCAEKTLTKTTTDVSGNTKTTEEYYPSAKAAVDLYKAYSSAVVDV